MTDLMVEQMRGLAAALASLQVRVRQAVAGEVSRAVAEAVAEILATALGGRLARLATAAPAARRHNPYSARRRTGYGDSEWDERESTGWGDEYVPVRASEEAEPDGGLGATDSGNRPAASVALALGVTAGWWWLGRRGSGWGAAGVGLAVASAVLAGGPASRAALGVLWAALRLLAVTAALGDGAEALDRA
jgi:hypothetical protein